MSKNIKGDRLEQLRGDLAALRARTAAEFGVPSTPSGDTTRTAKPPKQTVRPTDARSAFVEETDATARPGADAPESADRTDDWHAIQGGVIRGGSPGPIPVRRRRRPRPPRRSPFRSRTMRPPPRLAVQPPITVRRRPAYMVGARWPVWDTISASVAGVILTLAFGQLALRLWNTINDTAIVLGADPSRTDYLHAAAGVAGGGVNLALAVAALAIVKLRWGYLGAAAGVFLFFAVLPYYAYTATAGIISAPLPVFEQMIRPSFWGGHAFFTGTFWLAGMALSAAIVDLLWRAAAALVGSLRP